MPPKSKAAAAAAEPVAVEDLFTSIHRHIEAGAFEQAAKVADQGQALHLLPPRSPESRALTPVRI
jgi:signal recognition particle subunit SRP72